MASGIFQVGSSNRRQGLQSCKWLHRILENRGDHHAISLVDLLARESLAAIEVLLQGNPSCQAILLRMSRGEQPLPIVYLPSGDCAPSSCALGAVLCLESHPMSWMRRSIGTPLPAPLLAHASRAHAAPPSSEPGYVLCCTPNL